MAPGPPTLACPPHAPGISNVPKAPRKKVGKKGKKSASSGTSKRPDAERGEERFCHPFIEKYETATSGIGLRATWPIPRGTHIYSEPPVVSHPMTYDGEEEYTTTLLNQCFKLSGADQDELVALHNITNSAINAEWSPWMTRLLKEVVYAKNDIPPEIADDLPSLLDKPLSTWPKSLQFQNALAQATRAYHFLLAWDTHMQTITNVTNPDDRQYAVFLLTARINHSCVPNVKISYNELRGAMTAYAFRDIEAGEELTISYLEDQASDDGEKTIYLKRADRQKLLWHKWGFECTCRACADEEFAKSWDGIIEESVVMRLALNDLDRPWNEDFHSGNTVNLNEAMVMAVRLLVMIQKQGSKGIEVANM
jgi:hypothetical protein